MTHLLDTDVCIEILRGRDPDAQARLRRMGRVHVCAVTLAELSYGAARSQSPERNQEAVDALAAAVEVLDLDAAAARDSGRIRAELAALGTPIGGYDLLIAGVACAHDLLLVTGNLDEFQRVPGLRVEAW